MKEWNVGFKLDLGDTQLQCKVTVRAGDRLDAVAAAMAVITGGVRVLSVAEINAREKISG